MTARVSPHGVALLIVASSGCALGDFSRTSASRARVDLLGADRSMNPPDTRLLPNGRVGRRLGLTEFYYSFEIIEEIQPPAPLTYLPLAEGPSDRLEPVPVKFDCIATLWNEENYYAALYDEMHIRTPSNSSVASSSNSAYKPALSGHVQATVNDPEEGTWVCTADWWVDSVWIGQSQQPITVNYICAGDVEKSKIRQEYKDKNVVENRWVTCDDLATNHSSTYFSADELNRCNEGHHKHDLFAALAALKTGLDNMRTEFGRAITTTNAYRCPIHNEAVGSQNLTTSWHMAGRAADLWPVSPDEPGPEWQDSMKLIASAYGAQWDIYLSGMVHVEWEA